MSVTVDAKETDDRELGGSNLPPSTSTLHGPMARSAGRCKEESKHATLGTNNRHASVIETATHAHAPDVVAREKAMVWSTEDARVWAEG